MIRLSPSDNIFGHTRRYDDEQLRLLLLVRRLRAKKVPLQRIVPLLPQLRKTLAASPECTRFCFCGKAGIGIRKSDFVDWHNAHGFQILAAKDAAELLHIAAKHRGWFFVIEI